MLASPVASVGNASRFNQQQRCSAELLLKITLSRRKVYSPAIFPTIRA
jgi:hypothetical protein